MKVQKLKKLSKKQLPGLYCSPLLPPKNKAEAIRWAQKRGAEILYHFEEGKLWLVARE